MATVQVRGDEAIFSSPGFEHVHGALRRRLGVLDRFVMKARRKACEDPEPPHRKR